MECHHHHSGNRSQIFHLPLRLVSRCFLAAPRSQSVQADQLAGLNFSDRDKTEKFQLLPSLLAPSPSSSVCSVVPSVQVLRVELLVWPTGSWHVRVQDTKNMDLSNSTSPNGLSSLPPLWLNFQSFLSNLTPWKVYLCDAKPSDYSSRLVSYNLTG